MRAITNISSDSRSTNSKSLFDKLSNELTKNVEMGKRSGRETITPKTRLAIILRVLAGAGYGDIILGFQMGHSTVYQVFHDKNKVLMKTFTLPGLPQSMKGLKEQSLGFKHSRRRLSPFTGCVGAIDGIPIKNKKPSCRNAASFNSRKGFYSLPVQALEDSQYRFLDVSIRCVGSTNDQLAQAVSQLGQSLGQKKLEIKYWIVGDEAYICTNSLICPIPLSQVGKSWEDGFNFYLSSLRAHVERASGMLVVRWRVLNNLEFSVKVSSEIVPVCVKLYNFCVENRSFEAKEITTEEVCERNQDVLACYECCKERYNSWVDDNDAELKTDKIVLTKRDELMDVIRQKRFNRPLISGAPCRASEL